MCMHIHSAWEKHLIDHWNSLKWTLLLFFAKSLFDVYLSRVFDTEQSKWNEHNLKELRFKTEALNEWQIPGWELTLSRQIIQNTYSLCYSSITNIVVSANGIVTRMRWRITGSCLRLPLLKLKAHLGFTEIDWSCVINISRSKNSSNVAS